MNREGGYVFNRLNIHNIHKNIESFHFLFFRSNFLRWVHANREIAAGFKLSFGHLHSETTPERDSFRSPVDSLGSPVELMYVPSWSCFYFHMHIQLEISNLGST
jgi:hypothetical protein